MCTRIIGVSHSTFCQKFRLDHCDGSFSVWMNRMLDRRAQRVYAGVVCIQHGAQEQLALLLLLRGHVQPQLHRWIRSHRPHHNALCAQ